MKTQDEIKAQAQMIAKHFFAKYDATRGPKEWQEFCFYDYHASSDDNFIVKRNAVASYGVLFMKAFLTPAEIGEAIHAIDRLFATSAQVESDKS